MDKFYFLVATMKDGGKKFLKTDANGGYQYASDWLPECLGKPEVSGTVKPDGYLASQGVVSVECIEADPNNLLMKKV